ncbi:MAG TPA: 16S rRNA (guanine(527)-N(7))-methyltransferase RsmG [Burkholderiaceae bacterium]|nr:16S rRNA (guanine(527)-N(7))-methyltransferase RsmG [Burkholderiaceae bacterium]
MPKLEQISTALGLSLDPDVRQRLLQFLGLLQRWNATYNLTSVRDVPQMLITHLADCLAIVPAVVRQVQAISSPSLVDVGSGAGFPGVVLAVLLPSVRVTCVDAVAKKTAFLRQVGVELELKNFSSLHARVENVAGNFDIAASRAFSSLSDFVSLTRHLLKSDGVWMAMKGRVPEDQIRALPEDVDVFHVEQILVPQLPAERCVVWMRSTRLPMQQSA